MKKVVSLIQLEANRRNACKSTGPKTPEGKARIAANALTHGLASRNALLRSLPDESPEALAALRADFMSEWNPESPQEIDLVDRIATAHWQFMRCLRFEARAIARARSRVGQTPSAGIRKSEIDNLPILPDDSDLKALIRHEGSIDREFNRALRELIAVRKTHHNNSKPSSSATECTLPKESPGV